MIEIRAGPQYPEEPPHIFVVDSKGLDVERQKHLTDYIREKASELSSCLMLVALCEEAVETLSAMNHPDGNCPLCLCPLVSEEEEEQQSQVSPFMKLMSCFHCFHRWWRCIQNQTKINTSSTTTTRSLRKTRDHKNTGGAVEENMGNCPVCRKGFHAQDLDHVLHLVDNEFSPSSLDDNKDNDSQKFLQSDAEKARRENYEAIFKLQQENGGLIEPKKNIVVEPKKMVALVADESPKEQHREPPITPGMHPCGSSGRHNTKEHRGSSSRNSKPRGQI